MLVIEIDGSSHDNKYIQDQSRQNELEKLGVKIIRFDDFEVKKNMGNVLRLINWEIGKIEKRRYK